MKWLHWRSSVLSQPNNAPTQPNSVPPLSAIGRPPLKQN
jgi:hypothetical protein